MSDALGRARRRACAPTAACSPARDRATRGGRRHAARRRRGGGLARPARTRGDYALLVEAIREGYLVHYGEGRVLRRADPDLALLAGDRLYALGLDRLAELGDLDAVAELADVIALCAQAHAEGRPEDADAAWRGGVAPGGRPRRRRVREPDRTRDRARAGCHRAPSTHV